MNRFCHNYVHSESERQKTHFLLKVNKSTCMRSCSKILRWPLYLPWERRNIYIKCIVLTKLVLIFQESCSYTVTVSQLLIPCQRLSDTSPLKLQNKTYITDTQKFNTKIQSHVLSFCLVFKKNKNSRDL